MNIKKLTTLIVLPIFLSSCGLLGMHIKVHNPRHAGKYPKISNETILLGKQLTPIRQNFNVTFYDLDININPRDKTLGGWVEVRAGAVKDIDSVQLDLAMTLTIDELRWGSRNGQNLDYSRLYRGVFVKLPHQLQKGQTFSIHVKYHGKPVVARKPPWVGGLVWKKDDQKHDWDGVACETEGASIWFPCKDVTNEEPDSASMHFTIPDTSLFVVSNGIFLGSVKHGNFRSFNWKVSYPINLYDITFYVGDFVKVEDTYKGINGKELKLNHYVLKPNAELAAVHFRQVKKYIKAYEELYGEYCWYKDGFKLVEAPYAGMEHQTAIAYGSGFKNDLYGKDDYIMLHESGHEWFGNAVTAADLADGWLQEGITTYGESLYLEKAYNEYQALNHLLVYRMFIKNKLPMVGPYERRYFSYKDEDIYMKAAWMLHTLRNNINNDSLFFAILKTFYTENKLKVTNSNTFIETVNRVTGKDYKWFFDQYLYQNKVPFLEYQYSSDGSIYYRWKDVSEGFNKLRISLTFEGNKKSYNIFPDTRIQKINLPNGQDKYSEVHFNDYKALFGIKKSSKLKHLYKTQETGK